MAIRNKITKSLSMKSKGSIIIAQFSKYKITISQNRRSFSMSSILKRLSILSGSRGPDGSDLPSPLGQKFQLSVQFSKLFIARSDSDVDSEASRRLIRVQNKSRFLAKH